MARAVRDAKLDGAAARARLEIRKKPHYRLIEPGLHVGYYKGRHGGSWIGRRYIGVGRYETEQLGLADDGRAADGAEVMTFAQAQGMARRWATERARSGTGNEVADVPWTVADAVADWLEAYKAGRTEKGSGKAVADTQWAIRAHILPALGPLLLAELTSGRVERWLRSVAASPPRSRTRTGLPQRYRALDQGDLDAGRRRQATANRLLTYLKAALNRAWRNGHIANNDAWSRVRPYRDADAPKVRYLTDAEASRVMNACPPDFRNLVAAALLTGCRYAELASLRAADLDLDAGILTVRRGKDGSSRTVVLTVEAQRFFAGRIAKKSHADLVVPREDGTAWGKSHQFRPLRDACARAQVSPAISFHILRHTHASRLAMKGVPMGVIAAQLGHADMKITARHYAHLSPGYVAETVRAAFGDLGIMPESKIATPAVTT